MEEEKQVEERKPQKRSRWDCDRLWKAGSAFWKGSGCRVVAPALGTDHDAGTRTRMFSLPSLAGCRAEGGEA